MPAISIKIKNLPQIKRAFLKSPKNMVDDLNIAIKKSALAIQGQSMQNAPVRTGFLRRSHESIFGNLTATIMPTAYYAIFVHEGTRFMRGRPFLYEAVTEELDAVQNYFREAVQSTLDKLAKDFE